MKVSAADCIRCNPPNPEDLPLAGKARPICDACTEAARHPWRLAGNAGAPVAGKQPAKPKRRRKSGRNTTVSATALALLLIAIAGCTFHRTTSLDLGPLHRETAVEFNCDPRPALELPRTEPTES